MLIMENRNKEGLEGAFVVGKICHSQAKGGEEKEEEEEEEEEGLDAASATDIRSRYYRKGHLGISAVSNSTYYVPGHSVE